MRDCLVILAALAALFAATSARAAEDLWGSEERPVGWPLIIRGVMRVPSAATTQAAVVLERTVALPWVGAASSYLGSCGRYTVQLCPLEDGSAAVLYFDGADVGATQSVPGVGANYLVEAATEDQDLSLTVIETDFGYEWDYVQIAKHVLWGFIAGMLWEFCSAALGVFIGGMRQNGLEMMRE